MKHDKMIEKIGMTPYKEKMINEYDELKTKRDSLSSILERHRYGILDFTPTCPIDLLYRQEKCMNEYLTVLEMRAVLEGVNLNGN